LSKTVKKVPLKALRQPAIATGGTEKEKTARQLFKEGKTFEEVVAIQAQQRAASL
jgi:hypothetical protein